jgi:riboflavin kinase/FMN adenylyltransferase
MNAMRIARFPADRRPMWPQPIVALGNFDGLHRGHQQLLEEVRLQARERHGTAVALVFDPHPTRILRAAEAPPLIMTLGQKLDAFARAGMDSAAIVSFTSEVARWEPELFVETVLVDWLQVAEVRVGENFLFGRDRSGTFTLLRAIGEDRGFRVEKTEPVRYKDFVVSSSRIRHLIASGRVDEAGALLGHHFWVDGEVVHGDGRGAALGFPTANLRTENELMPAQGIYVSMVQIGEAWHGAVTSVGVRPTFGGGPVTIETYVLEGVHDLYGRRLRVMFVKWLRPEVAFDGPDELRRQIARDCDDAAAVFAGMAL